MGAIYQFENADIYLHHSCDDPPSDKTYYMHVHRRCEVYFYLSGDCYFAVEGNKYKLNNNDLLIMRPGEAHRLHVRSPRRYERIAVHFPSSLLEDPSLLPLKQRMFDRPLGTLNLIRLSAHGLGFLRECLARIEASGSDNSSSERVGLYLRCILQEISDSLVSKHDAKDDPESAPDETLTGELVRYLNCNLTQLKNLSSLKEVFFFSPAYLNRLFHRAIGSSIWDYVVLKRLLLARTLLQEGNSVTAACAQSGFDDYSSFFKQYKKRFGVTPIHDKKRT